MTDKQEDTTDTNLHGASNEARKDTTDKEKKRINRRMRRRRNKRKEGAVKEGGMKGGLKEEDEGRKETEKAKKVKE